MDGALRSSARSLLPEDLQSCVEQLHRRERSGGRGFGQCPACEGREVLIDYMHEPEDCPRCFGNGARLARPHLELAAFAGERELAELLGCSSGARPSWDETELDLDGFLRALERGWGPAAVLAGLTACFRQEPTQPLRVDPSSYSVVWRSLDWLRRHLDQIETIFGDETWDGVFDLLDRVCVEASREQAEALVPVCMEGVRLWALTGEVVRGDDPPPRVEG